MELTTKRSNLWYILPIVFGIVGGIIAGLIIRKNDPRKALICVIVGTVVSGLWIALIFASTDQPEPFVPIQEPEPVPQPEPEKTDKITKELSYDEIDRITWYTAQSLRTQQEYESVCNALENWLDHNDILQQNFSLVDLAYWSMCFKDLIWDINKEQDLINQGSEPLNEEIWSNAKRDPLDKFEFIPVHFGSDGYPTLTPFPSGKSEFCKSLQLWISDYEGMDWFTNEVKQEHDRLC